MSSQPSSVIHSERFIPFQLYAVTLSFTQIINFMLTKSACILLQNCNTLNPELNPICYLLALLVHHFLHVSRIRVKSLTLRLLMSYIYIYVYIYMEHLFLMLLDHTQRRSTVGRTPLDEWSARPQESYRLCCVVVYDLETSRIGAPYIYDISNLRVNDTVFEVVPYIYYWWFIHSCNRADVLHWNSVLVFVMVLLVQVNQEHFDHTVLTTVPFKHCWDNHKNEYLFTVTYS